MLDIKWIRDHPEAFDAGLKKRGISPGGDVKFASDLIALDEARREIVTRLQEAQARRNAASKEIGKAKGAKDEAKASALMAEVAALKDELAGGEEQQRAADKALHDALSVIPNLPLDEVPVGKDEHGNKEVRRSASRRSSAGPTSRRSTTRSARPWASWTSRPRPSSPAPASSCSRASWRAWSARSAQFMLDLHTAPEKDGLGGYTEIMPPYLVRDEVMFGTAQLPKFTDDQFLATRTITRAELLHDALKYAADDGKAAYLEGRIDLAALVDRTLERASF